MFQLMLLISYWGCWLRGARQRRDVFSDAWMETSYEITTTIQYPIQHGNIVSNLNDTNKRAKIALSTEPRMTGLATWLACYLRLAKRYTPS